MKSRQLRNSFILLLTATIWGVAFVAQSDGMNYVGPYTFNFTRSIIAGFFLIPIIYLFNKKQPEEEKVKNKKNWKLLLLGGICCGLALGIASCFQQIGIQYTTVGKAGFITTFYIIIVPLLGIFLKKKTGPFIWISVILALIGLYFLCIKENFTIEQGDLFIFACALCFSVHILVIDYFSPKVDGIIMSCIQFFVAGLLCFIPMLILEKPGLNQIFNAWIPILYAGVLSSGVGYTLQIIGQKGVNPTAASLILSLESVISVLAGMLLLGENLNGRELLGCILMFIAVILAQLPSRDKSITED